MTIEDPVEYRLPGCNQVQVNHPIAWTLPARYGPFCGRIPMSSWSGRCGPGDSQDRLAGLPSPSTSWLSTMHTNNALQAVSRLIEIGVVPFLVARSIIGVSAQRLVRRLCSSCREEYPMPAETVECLFGNIGDRTANLWRARGCANCGGTGYRERLAIHEVFLLTDAVRHIIAVMCPSSTSSLCRWSRASDPCYTTV